MFRFGEPLTLENVLKKVSPYQIFKYYCPKLNVGKVTNSPFRKDSRPSFGLFVDKDTGEVLYNDLGYSDSGNWIKFIRKLYNIEFKEVLRVVNRDLNLDLMDYSETVIQAKKVESKIVKDVDAKALAYDLELSVRKRPWTDADIKYWRQYGLELRDLGIDTFPISIYWFNDWASVVTDRHAYCYNFYNDGKYLRRKIYQPFSKADKWKTNLNTLVIDGIKDIPKSGELLIITKSRKDRLVLKKLGYNAIATNNEGSWIPESNYKKLKERYKRLVIFFDNDDAGVKASSKFAEKYNINSVIVPATSLEVKDISDYRKAYGETSTINLLQTIFK
jgi:DNA primase